MSSALPSRRRSKMGWGVFYVDDEDARGTHSVFERHGLTVLFFAPDAIVNEISFGGPPHDSFAIPNIRIMPSEAFALPPSQLPARCTMVFANAWLGCLVREVHARHASTMTFINYVGVLSRLFSDYGPAGIETSYVLGGRDALIPLINAAQEAVGP